MTRRLRVHNGVEDDLFEAFSYYADAAPDQIDRLYNLFLDAVTKRIPQVPNAFAPLFKHYRHIYLRIGTSTSGPSGTTLPIGRPTRLSTSWLFGTGWRTRTRSRLRSLAAASSDR